MPLPSDSELGPYKILSPLGRGGMGEVYRAKDSRLGRDVAIKVLPERLANDANALARFEKEARALATLSHPNILSIFDIGSDEGINYAVMELLEGETLRDRLNSGPIPWQKAVQLAIPIAEGLAAAHTKGIIHRDLKPENVFITSDEHVKILDFGLARQEMRSNVPDVTSAPTEMQTETGVVMGTLPYMSPEQASGKQIDARTDIFSFGCVLYEMLTGRRPFTGDTYAEILAAILKEDPRPMQLSEGTPAELDRIVSHCLEKNADRRFQSARDLAFHLRQIVPRTESSQSASIAGVRKSSNSRPELLRMVFAGVLVAAIGLFLWKFSERREGSASTPSIRSLAVMPLSNFSGDPNQEYFADGMTEALIADLAQIKSLKVISRTSVMHYKGTKKTLKEISDELKVDGIVEGSVIRSGNRVRVTAQLIHASDDQHLWAQNYEREVRDVLDLQSEVAGAIAREIKANLTQAEEKNLTQSKKIDPEVHELYLKARYFIAKGSEEDLRKAVGLLQTAINKDPINSLLYVGLASAYAAFADWFLAPAEVMPQSKAAALKAVDLNQDSSEAHTALGNAQMFYDYNWAAAESSFQRAIQLNANNADANYSYATLCAILGRREQSLAFLNKALELDPLSPVINMGAIWNTFLTRDYNLSIEYGRKALEFDPQFPGYYFMLTFTYGEKGDYQKAIEMAEKALQLYKTPMFSLAVAQYYASAGRKKDAENLLNELLEKSKTHYVCPYEMAILYQRIGQIDNAFDWLEKSYNERSFCIVYLQSDPRLDPLRSNPRYLQLAEKMRFPKP